MYGPVGQVGSASGLRAAQEMAQAAQAAFEKAQHQPAYAQGQNVADAPTALQALVMQLRVIRNDANVAVTNLNLFLQRATGEGALPPSDPGPELQKQISPMHEAADLLTETQQALQTLASIQSRVDRIA